MKVSNGKWNDAHCSKRKGFVCKKTPWAVPKNPAHPLIRGNCPPGYTADRYNNKCYRIFTTPMTWYYASKFCMTQGAEKYYLASINSDLDNAFLTTLLRGLNISPWIGLKKRTTGELFWSDNYDITYTNWYHGEPNGRNDMEMCAQIYGTQNNAGRWGALSCENKLPFICETKRKIYITTPNPISNPCESKKGYRPFGNACFKAMETPATWSAAQDYCKAHGAFLVTISNEFEQDFLRLLVNYEEFWTGLNDIERAGTYTWMNEAWPVIYTAWDDGEPSARDGACVSMNSATGRWHTTNCSHSLAYVCKITADDPPVTSPTPNGQCSGRDWLLNGRKCLLFRQIDYKTYLDATLECQREQASLVSIHSTAENQFLVQTIQTKYWAQKEGFWTGLHGSSSTGFSWSDQSPMNFFNWDQKPVSHYEWGNEDKCVEIDSQNGKWKYQDCAQKRGYICQKNPVVDMNTQTLPLHSNSNLASTSNTPTRQTPSLQTFTHKPDASIPTTNRNTQTLPTASTISPYTGPSVPVVDMNTQTLPPHSNSNLASTSNTPTRQTPSLQTFTHKPDASIPTTNRNTQTLPTASTISPYTGPSVPGALKSSGGSTELNGGGRGGSKVLNGGSIAGILVAAIIVVVLVIALLVVFKRVRQSRGGATLSFDNTAYRYDTKQENGESDT
ncbi:macrophage mannose receptor 1-like [Ostrea edulis]|uniref:macrophage mannose receptor 1-like n=1 Tax=Ostrea edulis TaxID=37623 RepID=UPI0024AF2764|nr:macrophage mannose receptor 1-like [Ostrea edulis]